MKECVDVERVLAGAIYTLVSSRMHTRKLPSVKTANFRLVEGRDEEEEEEEEDCLEI